MNITTYKPEYCEMLKKHMSQGYSFTTFTTKCGAGLSTMYDWCDKHPDFKQAKDEAFALAQQFFEQRLLTKLAGVKLENVDGKLIDTSCLIFALKTRFHKDYSEKVGLDHTSSDNSFKLSYKLDKPEVDDV